MDTYTPTTSDISHDRFWRYRCTAPSELGQQIAYASYLHTMGRHRGSLAPLTTRFWQRFGPQLGLNYFDELCDVNITPTEGGKQIIDAG